MSVLPTETSRRAGPHGTDAAELFTAQNARAVAEAVYGDEEPLTVFPADAEAGQAAIGHLAGLLEGVSPLIRRGMVGAERSAAHLSDDRLQGLIEIIQNADDLGASQVRFRLDDDHDRDTVQLLATHDGSPVRLPDVMGMAVPWLSLKAQDAAATGRFGIGLMTLRSLGEDLHVHSGHLHYMLRAVTLTALPAREAPQGLELPGGTLLAVPLRRPVLDEQRLKEWFEGWDDASLLFLRHVRQVVLVDGHGRDLVTLRLRVSDERPVPGSPMRRHAAQAADGRRWTVYRTDLPVSADAERFNKAKDETTPLAVAFADGHDDDGWLHAGLPVRPVALPFRVGAQFDPLANRRDIADVDWNSWLLTCLGELWVDAALDRLAEKPEATWDVVPNPVRDAAAAWPPGQAGAALDEAVRSGVRAYAERFALPADGGPLGLGALAVEAPELTAVLRPADVRAVAGTAATLPEQARDGLGRWREVLGFFGSVDAPRPVAVTVPDALALMEQPGRGVEFVIALAAVGVDAGLGDQLRALRCAVAADGGSTVPPGPAAPDVLIDGDVDPVFDALKLGRRLHPSYGLSDDGRAVRSWLADIGALLTSPTVQTLLSRLSAAGESGKVMDDPLEEDQLRSLRDAFEALPPGERERLGPGVGRAVRLHAVRYGADGKPVRLASSPAEAYVIEHDADSWYVAAHRTAGLTWLDRRHVETLRRPRGAPGLGAQRLFRLLGAQTAPRLVEHPAATQRFKHRPWGVPLSSGTDRRRSALAGRGASYTIHDHVSPDLQAVLADLAQDKDAGRRRKRANAVVATLARAWTAYGDLTTAQAVQDSGSWIAKGDIPASWLFDASAVEWMPNANGTARRPDALVQRTAVNVAHYGSDRRQYAHPDVGQAGRAAVLDALGVTGDPPATQLMEWLRELRHAAPNGSADVVAPITSGRASAIYEALAATQRGAASTRTFGDLSVGRVREMFGHDDGLVLTNVGWRRPSTVLVGPPVFGRRRPSPVPTPNVQRLWQALGMRGPTARDARDVLSDIATQGGAPDAETTVVMMESWKLIAMLGTAGDGAQLRMNRLPLWTSQGWSRRPVFAVTDPELARALAPAAPVWLPGGAADQYRALFGVLAVTEVASSAAEVVAPDDAVVDDQASELFAAAVRHLQADLARDDPAAEASMTVPWEDLAGFAVAQAPNLRVTVRGVAGLPDPVVDVPAFVDTATRTLYARDASLAGRVHGGGRAMAALSSVPSRRIAYAWRAAWDDAEDRKNAEMVRLARMQEAERGAAAEAARRGLQDFAQGLAQKHRAAPKAAKKAVKSASDGTTQAAARPPRNLIDTEELQVANADGDHRAGRQPHPTPAKGKKGLRPPDMSRKGSSGGGRGPTNYTPEETERRGLDLVLLALASDRDDVKDIRDQRGVGADAVDGLRRFFELKVHAGPAPDDVSLTESEVQRAAADDQFFLAVVSNVEAGRGVPEVRFYIDPLKTVGVKSSSGLRIGPLSGASSVGYTFESRPDA